jgi:uncharacterized protein YhhL (DUF1145 family)
MSIIAGKVLLSFACAVFGVLLATHPRLLALSERRFRLAVYALWALTRVGIYVAAFLILRLEPQSDIVGAYMPQAQQAMQGLWVYRDFDSTYAPLFPYALAVVVEYVWYSSKMIVLLAVLAELVSLPFWMAALERLIPPRAVRQACLLYLASALPMFNVAFQGQNQVWASPFAAIALWLYSRESAASSGLALSVPLVVSKFLSLAIVPAFVPRKGRVSRFIAGFVVLQVIVFGFFVFHHVDVLVPIWDQRTMRTPGNLPYLLCVAVPALTRELPTNVIDALGLLIVAALALWLVARRTAGPSSAAVWALNLLMLSVMLASRKAPPAFLVSCFFPVCAVVAREALTRLRALLFGVFGLVATIEPSMWFRWVKGYQIPGLGLAFGPGVSMWRGALFILIDVVLVGFYACYWYTSWRALRAATRECVDTASQAGTVAVSPRTVLPSPAAKGIRG